MLILVYVPTQERGNKIIDCYHIPFLCLRVLVTKLLPLG